MKKFLQFIGGVVVVVFVIAAVGYVGLIVLARNIHIGH